MPKFTVIVLLIIWPILGLSQEAELHRFTDKRGNQITATLLEVLSDHKRARIRRVDGQEFTTNIVLFSLDDQQYVKDWMQRQKVIAAGGVETPEFHLQIEIDHEKAGRESYARGSRDLEKTPNYFEIIVSNTSRETLEGATLEYMVIREEGVTVYEDERDGEWTYTYPRADSETVVVTRGQEPLETLPFNRDVLISTEEVEIERVVTSEGDIQREDKLLGAMVRVVNADGKVLAETTAGKAELASHTWESSVEIAAMAMPDE